ncbi:MAG: preprotein translocase subunit SecE [Syntrophobacteraceae bacterium]
MKLFAKKDQSSDKKLHAIETVKKAAAKPVAAKPVRPKKTDIVKKTDTTKKAVKKPGETSIAWVDATRSYLREVVFELKKVVWPSRKETLGSTAVVLVIVGLSAVFLGIVDLILSRLVKLLVG